MWLNTKQMATLFDKEESNIRRHITNIFKEAEVDRENNVHFLHVNGVKKPVPYYTLDVIISVGYRVHKTNRHVRETSLVKYTDFPPYPRLIYSLRFRVVIGL